MVTKQITLNVWKKNSVILGFIQGEVDSRYIEVTFNDESGTLNLANKQVTFYAQKPDGTLIFNDCAVDSDKNTATVAVTSQMESVAGFMECEFQIFNSENSLLKVNGLKILIVSDKDFSEAVESTSECNALLEAIHNAQNYGEELEKYLGEVGILSSEIGTLSDLTTEEKTSLVGAVNEVNSSLISNVNDINTNISQLNTKVIPISQGGTGATTAAEALTNIGAAASAHTHSASSITSGTLPISRGGTGAATVSTARTTLGFSTATSLYSNSSGTHSTITLSGDVSNYDAIGIYCFWESQDIYGSRYYEILASSSKTSLYNLRTSNDGNGVVLCGYNITVTSNTITFVSYSNYKSIYITSDNTTNSSEFYGRYLTNQIPYITKVVGYKY